MIRILAGLMLFPSLAAAQIPEADRAATAKFIASLYDASSGGYRVDAKSPPSLRATSGAVRAYGYLRRERPDSAKTAAFVMKHYDPTRGSFNEEGAAADVTITSIGLMAAGELMLTINRELSVEYLHREAKTFEDVRIGAAGLEAIQVKPKWLDDWIRIADAQLHNDGSAGKGDGKARDTASVAAMKLRLGYPLANRGKVAEAILSGQRPDGGWGKAGAKSSDLETTYRVMRALHWLKEKPRDVKALNAFLQKCRNSDGGYSVDPGNPSTMSGVYYASAINRWLEK